MSDRKVYTFPGDEQFIREAIEVLDVIDVTPSQVRTIKPFTEFTSLIGQAFHNKSFTPHQRKDILAEAIKREALIRVASKAAELIAACVEMEVERIADAENAAREDAEAETTRPVKAASAGRHVSSLKLPINKDEQDLFCLTTLGKIKPGDVLAVGDDAEAEKAIVVGIVSRNPCMIRVARAHEGTPRRNAPEGTSIIVTDQKPSD